MADPTPRSFCPERRVYGLAAITHAGRAAVCSLVGHRWAIERKACARCDLYDEERLRLGLPAASPLARWIAAVVAVLRASSRERPGANE